jgi:hypothetical protein
MRWISKGKVLRLVKRVTLLLVGLRGRYGAATLVGVGLMLGSLRLQRWKLIGAHE